MTLAEPLCPSLEAVTETVPALTPRTRPDAETVATAVLPELHVIARPVRTLLFASRVTADSCTVAPTWTLGLDGETETDATGTGAAALTVKIAAPDLPSLVALMFAVPAPTAVTSPVAATVATPALSLCHVIVRPVSALPPESLRVAVACAV